TLGDAREHPPTIEPPSTTASVPAKAQEWRSSVVPRLPGVVRAHHLPGRPAREAPLGTFASLPGTLGARRVSTAARAGLLDGLRPLPMRPLLPRLRHGLNEAALTWISRLFYRGLEQCERHASAVPGSCASRKGVLHAGHLIRRGCGCAAERWRGPSPAGDRS